MDLSNGTHIFKFGRISFSHISFRKLALQHQFQRVRLSTKRQCLFTVTEWIS